MKKLFLFNALYLLLLINTCYSQSIIQFAEIMIKNHLDHEITILIYPVGATFSGYNPNELSTSHLYTFKRCHQESAVLWPIKYIIGGNKTVSSNGHCVVDFDDGLYYNLDPTKMLGGVGIGLWKMQITYEPLC